MADATERDIERIIAGYNNAIEASNYADSLVLEMQVIQDTDYIMVWSNAVNE